jgi:hypothetical protein
MYVKFQAVLVCQYNLISTAHPTKKVILKVTTINNVWKYKNLDTSMTATTTNKIKTVSDAAVQICLHAHASLLQSQRILCRNICNL